MRMRLVRAQTLAQSWLPRLSMLCISNPLESMTSKPAARSVQTDRHRPKPEETKRAIRKTNGTALSGKRTRRVPPTGGTAIDELRIRMVKPNDLQELRRITIEGFDGTAIDQSVERAFGKLGGHDWKWRKGEHVTADYAANPTGMFVAEEDGCVIGYISTQLDREAGKGRIPNLAVDSRARGHGVGRRLIEHAIEYFRREGMAYAVIETMDNNAVGQHLYPSCGFLEICRQIHYAMKL